MTIQNRVLSTANDGLVDVVLTYDDVTRVIQTIALRNDGTSGVMTATLFDRDTHAVIFGPSTRTFDTGTIIQDLSSIGLSMVIVPPDRFSPDGLAIPFSYSLGWSSA